MSWAIVNADSGTIIEIAQSPKAASRALFILTAHELKNNRKPNLRIVPPIDLAYQPKDLNLPDWVLEELKKEGAA